MLEQHACWGMFVDCCMLSDSQVNSSFSPERDFFPSSHTHTHTAYTLSRCGQAESLRPVCAYQPKRHMSQVPCSCMLRHPDAHEEGIEKVAIPKFNLPVDPYDQSDLNEKFPRSDASVFFSLLNTSSCTSSDSQDHLNSGSKPPASSVRLSSSSQTQQQQLLQQL